MADFLKTKYLGVTYYESVARGDKCFYITYFIGGKVKREKIGWGKEGFTPLIASEIRAKRTAAARHGEEYTKLTLGEGVRLYLTTKQTTAEQWEWELNTALNYFGHSTLLSSIKPNQIIGYINYLKALTNKRGRPYASQTIMHFYAAMRQMYNFLIDTEVYHGKSPLTKEAKKAVPLINNQIINYFSIEETKSVIAALESYSKSGNLEKMMLSNFFQFAMFTGFRRNEILKLSLSDVDLMRRIIILRDPKSGRDEIVEASKDALSKIENQLELIKQHNIKAKTIFCLPNGEQRKEVKTQFQTLKKAAGITRHFRFHDLRHNFATAVLDAGAELYVVQKLLTHKDPKTTQKYAHIKTGRLGSAAQAATELMKGDIKKV